MGRAVEPVFAPIGWDWKVGMAVLASFPAREVVVSTLGAFSTHICLAELIWWDFFPLSKRCLS